MPLEDLIEEGNLGLLRAAEAYDPSMNTRFSTYASYWIRQSMRRAWITSSKMIHLPTYTFQLRKKWRNAAKDLQAELGRHPTHDEIAGRLRLSQRQVRIVLQALRIADGHEEGSQDHRENPIEEAIADRSSESPAQQLCHREDVKQVLALVDKMCPRKATILRLRYGLAGTQPRTLAEIGAEMQLTRERVRQLEREALKDMAKALNRNESGDEPPILS
jgi:RNA polymerase primary sigma factor